MKIGVVGMGYWGPNLVRNFLSTEGVESVICCDLERRRLDKVRKQFFGIEVCPSVDELFARSDIDAVALATPTSTHHTLGIRALESGKHLLVEKPFALTSLDAESLLERARRSGLTCMVDHTFLYTSAVRKIKEYLLRGEIGDILYFDSVRVNLGLFQRDTNVLWDLAPHDIAIMDHLIGQEPLSVSALGASHYNGLEDIAYVTLTFPGNIIAHFHVNWISPVKIRKILLGGSKLMLVYDDMEPSEKVRVYNKGVTIKGQESIYRALVEYRIGDMFAPHVDQTEALGRMTKDFIDSIRTGKQSIADAEAGLNVVRILEAADQSLRTGGRVVTFSRDGRAIPVPLSSHEPVPSFLPGLDAYRGEQPQIVVH